MKLTPSVSTWLACVAVVAQASAFSYDSRVDSRMTPVPISQSAGQGNIERSLTLSLDHYDVWKEDVPALVPSVITVLVEDYDWVKVNVPSKGTYQPPTHADWDGFFNASASARPGILAGLIDGIGMPTAKKIVKANVFDRKPKSWEEFKDVIEKAQDKIGDNNLYNNVIARSGSQNKQKLYGTGTRGEKRGNFYYEYQKVGQHFDTQVILVDGFETKTYEKLKYSETASVRFSVLDSVLVGDETEKFTLRFDGRNVDVRESGTYNRYVTVKNDRDNFGNFEVQLKSVERYRIKPSNTLKLNLYSKNGKMWLEVTDTHPAAAHPGAGNPQVIYKVYQAGFFKNKLVKEAFQNFPRGGQTTTIDLGVPAVKGEMYYVETQLKRFDSSLFSDEFVKDTKETPWIDG